LTGISAANDGGASANAPTIAKAALRCFMLVPQPTELCPYT
jgi:hypothetical protein